MRTFGASLLGRIPSRGEHFLQGWILIDVEVQMPVSSGVLDLSLGGNLKRLSLFQNESERSNAFHDLSKKKT